MDSKSVSSSSDLPRIAIIRMEGTNNEDEAYYSFKRSGSLPNFIHINEISRGLVDLDDYSSIFIPGGFSAGDYVRAGAIFAARLRYSVMDKLLKFIDTGKPVIGVCNGFQVLAELGLIPDVDGKKGRVVTLAPNESFRYECRYVYFKMASKNKIFSKRFKIGEPRQVPVGHAEGRIRAVNKNLLERISDNNQILFKYSNPEGDGCGYPWNPNGSDLDTAAITNPEGNVVGLMPHPERVYYPFQMMGKEMTGERGTGKDFFDSIVEYTRKNR
ncbi:MAG: phosphoribosylformylglycinamidine synthase subunit PurQ [Thermoplasmataceae archaeon]